MKIRTMALFAGSAIVLAASGVGAAACSGDGGTGTGNPLNSVDSSTKADGTMTTEDGSTVDGGGTPGEDASSDLDAGSNADGAATADCGKVSTLHPTDGSTGTYCPFQANDAGKNCGAGLACCAPKFPADPAAQTCVAMKAGHDECTFAAASMDGGLTIECEEDNECAGSPGGSVCCLVGAIKQDPGCTNSYGSHINGAFCRSACAAGELHVCQTQAACATGMCTPFRAAGRDWAACK